MSFILAILVNKEYINCVDKLCHDTPTTHLIVACMRSNFNSTLKSPAHSDTALLNRPDNVVSSTSSPHGTVVESEENPVIGDNFASSTKVIYFYLKNNHNFLGILKMLYQKKTNK